MNYDDESIEEKSFKTGSVDDESLDSDTDEPPEEINGLEYEEEDPDSRYH